MDFYSQTSTAEAWWNSGSCCRASDQEEFNNGLFFCGPVKGLSSRIVTSNEADWIIVAINTQIASGLKFVKWIREGLFTSVCACGRGSGLLSASFGTLLTCMEDCEEIEIIKLFVLMKLLQSWSGNLQEPCLAYIMLSSHCCNFYLNFTTALCCFFPLSQVSIQLFNTVTFLSVFFSH